jgi:hypothetical protein
MLVGMAMDASAVTAPAARGRGIFIPGRPAVRSQRLEEGARDDGGKTMLRTGGFVKAPFCNVSEVETARAPRGPRREAGNGLFEVGKLTVFVMDKRKRPLMPCEDGRARLLLGRGRAVIDECRVFTIRLKGRIGGEVRPAGTAVLPATEVARLRREVLR